MVSYDPPIPIPSRLPVLPLPYPLILHPSLLLSIPLTYAHSLSLLKAAIRVSDPSAADFGSGNAPGDAGDRKQRSVKGDTNPAFDGNRPIIVACVPTIRAPHGSNGGGKELVKRADKNGQNGGTGDAGAGPEDERVKVNDLHEWGVAARLLRLTRHPASQTCTLLVTGLTRVRIDRWLSVRAPLTSTALDRDRNLNVPDVPVPLAQTTAFLDSEPWPYAPEATAADIALVRTLKKAANELLDALAFPPPAVGPSGDAAAGTPPSPLPGTSIPLLPPALLKRLRSFVKDAKDNQAGLVADVVTGTLGGACEWADRIAVLADWDQQERTRNAGEALAKGAGRVKLARELLSTLTSPLNSSSREGLIRSQLEALLAQLAALNPNITARITTSSGSFGGGKNGDHNNGKVGGIITIRSPDASENNNNKGGIMPFSAPRGNSGGHSLSGRGGSGGGSGGNDEEEDEVAELARRLERTALSPEARKACERELKRLSRIPPQSVERGVLITYLEWMADLPWEKNSADLDPVADAHAPKAIGGAPKEAENDEGIVERARRILDEDHYGLEKIKRRLVEYLAVLELKSSQAAERAIAEEAAQPKAQIGLPTESAQSTTEGQEDGDIQHLEDAVVEENKRQADKKRRQTVPDKGPILLLVGPPGTGKTSIAVSVMCIIS